ncbi:DNA gyrase subunit A [Candidatus Sumerlaea chitinivorans]|uniref:DNA gyrase subunit A n=1 Tax=Sumerlaea chitinivorans TaxID=2250252 RepID=A0A2Z4Y5I0_SUMC1|nr:DNA gyrase subunit A [Candidatus Sumerlaea chitinivorans]
MQDSREQVIVHNIEDEVKTSYLDYAMSVIIGRALPDVRDGLKPVHRRIIYAMYDLGFTSTHKYEKSAKSVGAVMGNYHPHGDQAIYETLVRMAQDFSMRYPLIDGQGNFGSIDNDPPAAMRYTEARLSKFAELLLQDLDKNTVDWAPNYDGSLMEPTVLPCAFPNLLVNGSGGIAVGMSTNIPPHNLREIIDACVTMIDNPNATVADLMKHVKGPDFPTGAYIYGRKGIVDAYSTGRGRIIVRARMRVEQLKGGRTAIVVTELPFQVNKAGIVEDIANLIRDKKLTGISDLRDESDRDGIRIVIELRKDEVPEVVMNNLYKHTQLQTTFGVIMLALVDGRPRYLSLPRLIQHYLNHRRDVVVRRTRFELDRAEKRIHIVLGLCVVQDNIDAVVKIIRNAANPEEAKAQLMARFKVPLELLRPVYPDAKEAVPLSAEQAQAILDMRLSRLTQLEKNKLLEERDQLTAAIAMYRKILGDMSEVWKIVRRELLEIRDKYGDERRTEILDESAELTIEDLIADENMVITISHQGYIKRTPTDQYRRQRRGGKGVTGAETKEEDWVEHLFIGTTHNYLMFFTDRGQAYWLKVYEIPQAGRAAKGRAVVNLLNLDPNEKICAVLPVRKFEEENYLIFATARGKVCKQSLSLYAHPRKTGIKAIKIAEGDTLVDVKLTNGQSEIILATRKGMAIRFHETTVRPMGRDTAGVCGITLRGNDEVIGLETPRPGATLLTVCENGYGKRSAIEDYRLTNRGGVGVINIKTTERNGLVVAVKEVIDDDELIVMTRQGVAIRVHVSDIRVISRNTQGVRIINLEAGDVVTGVARLAEKDDAEAEEGEQTSEADSSAADDSGDSEQ